MSSVSSDYMTMIDENEENSEKKESAVFEALVYSTQTNLMGLLLATSEDIEKLPIIYTTEAQA
ncbi:MAG: hypothetical protein ISR96_09590 [Nitrospira sp.]|nr:hypothetical protein [Nitrospira sp.]